MKGKKIRNIIIDFTSLLDVVMILIFVIMIVNTDEANKVREENAGMAEELANYAELKEDYADAQAKLDEGSIDELLGALDNANSRLEAYEYMDDIVLAINVTLENERNSVRTLTFGYGAETDTYKNITAKRNNDEKWQGNINKLKLFINDYINSFENEQNDAKTIYVIFSANHSKVYDNDFSDVENAIKSVIGDNENIIYIAKEIEENENEEEN